MGANSKKRNKNRNKKKGRENAQLSNISEQLSGAKPDSEELSEAEPSAKSGRNIDNSNSNKRHHDDNDSDNEENVRKKKKKKQLVSSDTTKKGNKSIRQIKREKFAQRQAEAQAVAKDHLKNQCLNYLSQWKHDKSNWKFMKAKQVWLYKNKFSTNLLPDTSWPLLLEYFESAQGNIRKMLLDDAQKIIKQMDEWIESQSAEQVEVDNEEQNNDTMETPKLKRPNDDVYKRARDLIQCLEE